MFPFKNNAVVDHSSRSCSPEYGALARLADGVILLILRKNFSQAEVSDLHQKLALHQNVPGGQISMDVAPGRQVVHPLNKPRNTLSSSSQSIVMCVCERERERGAFQHLADLRRVQQQLRVVETLLVFRKIIS